jgi:3-isopropylmalate/(R)-2-methylmalate dehydratase large subunit
MTMKAQLTRDNPPPKTLFDKVWHAHIIEEQTEEKPALIYIDLHLIHEVTSPQAFSALEERGLKVRRPDRTFATLDHSTPTLPADENGIRPYATEAARHQVATLETNTKNHGIKLFGWDSQNRGVVHVIGPELGLTRPGMTIVCGDSHTSTHGAFGAIAFGIGTSEVGHVLASQCLLQSKPKTMRITIKGSLAPYVSAKDVALTVIKTLGFAGGTGFAIEYAGPVVEAMDMEARMTLCNLSIEAGARCGMVAPDETTINYLKARLDEKELISLIPIWHELRTEDEALFDRELVIDGTMIRPMMTWGTSPDQASPIAMPIPRPEGEKDQKSLTYMGFEGGQDTGALSVDVVFIGSCTNGRLSDLIAASEILKGKTINNKVRMLVVPGSAKVAQEAEALGLDQIFLNAGAQWRLPGCSMCIAMNGDIVAPGQICVSTSNRNFEGRQGPGARTILASPATAAACALTGFLTDPQSLMA